MADFDDIHMLRKRAQEHLEEIAKEDDDEQELSHIVQDTLIKERNRRKGACSHGMIADTESSNAARFRTADGMDTFQLARPGIQSSLLSIHIPYRQILD